MELVVSCTNDIDSGGIYILDSETLFSRYVHTRQCMGMVKYASSFIVGSHGLKNSQQRIFWQNHEVKPHSLIFFNHDWAMIDEIPLLNFKMGDIHDLRVHQGKLYVVDTFRNRVVAFLLKSFPSAPDEKNLRLYLEPVLEWVDPITEEPDSSHVNSICIHQGRILVSVFGRFRKYKEYEKRSDVDGCVLDITEGFRKFGSSDYTVPPKVVFEGLSDPHTLISHKGFIYFTEARRRTVKKNNVTIAEFSKGYIRGICFTNDEMWVGVSASRHADKDIECAQICRVAIDTGVVSTNIPIPAQEIYEIIACK